MLPPRIFFTTPGYRPPATGVVVRTMSFALSAKGRLRQLPYSLYTFRKSFLRLGSALPFIFLWEGFTEFDSIHTAVSVSVCSLPKVPCVCLFRHSGL